MISRQMMILVVLLVSSACQVSVGEGCKMVCEAGCARDIECWETSCATSASMGDPCPNSTIQLIADRKATCAPSCATKCCVGRECEKALFRAQDAVDCSTQYKTAECLGSQSVPPVVCKMATLSN